MTKSGTLAAVVVAASSLAIVACSTATPYQPAATASQGASGGYSDRRLGTDRYEVTFTGNSLTSRDRVEGYLLYRAAELTLEQGADWFLIVDRLVERDAETYVTRDPFYRPWYGPGYGNWRPYWRYYRQGVGWRYWQGGRGDPFWADRVDVHTVERFEAHAEIIVHRGPIPAGEERAFDARKVVQDLGPTIERPKPRR